MARAPPTTAATHQTSTVSDGRCSASGRELSLIPRPLLLLPDGFPRCYGRDHPDPTLDFHGHPFNPGDCPFNALGNIALAVKEQVGAVVDLPPHSATLGLTWYPSNAPTGSPAFPPEYRGRVFYASHGSWDRTIPSGYVVGMAAIENPTQANSHTPQPSLEEFLGGFILEPKVSCQTSDDCPGSSHCQTNGTKF